MLVGEDPYESVQAPSVRTQGNTCGHSRAAAACGRRRGIRRTAASRGPARLSPLPRPGKIGTERRVKPGKKFAGFRTPGLTGTSASVTHSEPLSSRRTPPTMPDWILHDCPSCGNTLRFPAHRRDEAVRCPLCKTMVHLDEGGRGTRARSDRQTIRPESHQHARHRARGGPRGWATNPARQRETPADRLATHRRGRRRPRAASLRAMENPSPAAPAAVASPAETAAPAAPGSSVRRPRRRRWKPRRGQATG